MPRAVCSPWIGPVLAAFAAVVYAFTLSSGPYPGESAHLIAQHSGAMPILGTSNPLWGFIAWLIVRIPIGDPSFRLNIFSLICGSLAVWQLYRLLSSAVLRTIDDTTTDRRTAAIAARLAGIAGALYLVFSIPFWYVSTRAHTASFDLLLLLVAANLMVDFLTTYSRKTLYLFAFLYGIGVVEFTTFIVMAPVFAGLLIFEIWMKQMAKPALIINAGLCFVAGLFLYLLAALRFYGTVGYTMQDFDSFFQVLWVGWRNQYWIISHGLPKQGWLLVVIVGVIPWFACMLAARRALNAETDWGFYVLHIVITIVAAMGLFDIKISPWGATQGARRVLVTPYALLAMVYGYLVAYWFLLPKSWEPAFEIRWKIWLKNSFGKIAAILAFAGLVAAAVLNSRIADARSAAAINSYSETVVANMGTRTWLVTDGMLDSNILMAARKLGKTVRLLNLNLGENEAYMRYVSTFFDDPRLKSLAQVGLLPLLGEWIPDTPDAEKQIAVFASPDLWLATGRIAIPCMNLFLGAGDMKAVNVTDLIAKHEKFWAQTVPMLEKTARSKAPVTPAIAGFLLQYTSLVANNLGVLLADMGDADGAFRIYSETRKIAPKNTSALLNQFSMIESGYKAKEAAEIKAAVERLLAPSEARTDGQMWSLSRSYGYVRTADAFANLGHVWALSGKPGLAIAGLSKAIALKSAKTDQMRSSLAFAHSALNDSQKSEAIYRDLIAGNPNDVASYLGLARIAAWKGDFKNAATLIETAESKGASGNATALEWASLRMLEGSTDKAKEILENVVMNSPDTPEAWLMLGCILLQKGNDTVALNECIERLLSRPEFEFHSNILSAQAALVRKDNAAARKSFERALLAKPNVMPVLEALLRMDMMEDQKERSAEHIRDILAVDPNHAAANYALGSLQLARNELELAETSFRKSLQRNRSPEALNDLAWLLYQKGSLQEAEKLARNAVELDDKMEHAHDTLGVILMKTGRHDEAMKELLKTLSLNRNNLGAYLNLSEVYTLKGERVKAAEILTMLHAKRDVMPAELQMKLDRLRRAAKAE